MQIQDGQIFIIKKTLFLSSYLLFSQASGVGEGESRIGTGEPAKCRNFQKMDSLSGRILNTMIKKIVSQFIG